MVEEERGGGGQCGLDVGFETAAGLNRYTVCPGSKQRLIRFETLLFRGRTECLEKNLHSMTKVIPAGSDERGGCNNAPGAE